MKKAQFMSETFTSDVEPLHLSEYDDALFENQILNVPELAVFLKISSKTVYRMALRGELPAKRVGRSYRFLRLEIIRWLKIGGNHGKRI
jgi:excisionase family DNA binding protein